MATSLPISVVIPTRNRGQLLAEMLESVLAGDELPSEVIVIDQSDVASDSPVSRGTGGCVVRHLRTSTRGLSRARNLGAAAARQPLLAFADDDMRADRRWIGALTNALTQAGPLVAVTGRVTAGAPETASGFVPATVNREEAAAFRGRLAIDVLAGGNMALDRDAFLRVGGFDPRLGAGARFSAAEDNDLGYRLLEAGFGILYEPRAVLEHRAWRPMAEYLPVRMAYGRGKGAFYIKHSRLDDWHMPRRMARDLLSRGVRGLRRARHPRLAAGELVYAAGVLCGACEWLLNGDRDL